MTRQIVFTISILLCFSAFSQKSKVVFSVSKEKVEVGETIVFTVQSNIEATSVQIDNKPGSYIVGSPMMNSASEYIMNHNTGGLIALYTYTEMGTFTKPGKYKIGPAYVTSRTGKAYQSNTITIEVTKKVHLNNGEITAKQQSDPAFGVIQLNKTRIYEGESIIVGAKVYSRFQPTKIGNYNTFIQRKGIEFQELKNSSRNLKVREERYKGNEYFTFEYDRNLIFPSGTGFFTLDPFTMDVIQGFKGYSLRSSGASIEILPLPGNTPSDFIGAVGSFNLERSIDTSRVKQGEVFKLTLSVSGVGNIQNSLEPKLNLPKGMVVYGDPIVTKDISYGVNGAEGQISYEFNIQASSHGSIKIPGTSISYFDPVSAQYKTIVSEDQSIYVVQDKSIVATENKATVKDEAIYTHSASDLRLKKEVRSTRSIFGTTLFWSGVSAPLICAFLFLFFVRRREQSAGANESKQAIQKKDKELHALVAESKALMKSGENDAFYSSIENTLKKAFECKMGVVDTERILSKQEIYTFLQTNNQERLLDAVRSLFRTCEESRFGFSDSDDHRRPDFSQLESILKELNP